MTKRDFAKLLSKRGVFVSQTDAESKLDLILDEIENILKTGETVSFVNFGKFEVITREARIGRNPKTGKEIKIAEKRVLKFKPGRRLATTI